MQPSHLSLQAGVITDSVDNKYIIICVVYFNLHC